ncbi:MAG: murein transglycosylase A [Dongiaceae bacterium]
MKYVLLFLLGAVLNACALPDGTPPLGPQAPAALNYTPVEFNQLPGWEQDNLNDAISPFKLACLRAAKISADWQKACRAVAGVPLGEGQELRAVLERYFQPYRLKAGEDQAFFTGYYLPALQGSLKKTSRFSVPLYGVPENLVTFNPQQFDATVIQTRWTGRLEKQGRNLILKPYFTRAEIDQGALKKAKPLVWVDNAVDAFFLHIQGSGIIELPKGKRKLIGYAANNGHSYQAIGRYLREKNLIASPVSMQKIREYLEKNPKEAAHIFAQNPSYVFFQWLEGDAPLGAAQLPLTPARALAVDPKHIRLGLPLWAAVPEKNWQKLMLALDTGGAIKGPLRGDIYFGPGDRAAAIAGELQQSGELYMILPKNFGGQDDGG